MSLVTFFQLAPTVSKVAEGHGPMVFPQQSPRDEILGIGEPIFQNFKGSIPASQIIPEFRKIQQGTKYTYSWDHLIEVLAGYQHPPEGKDIDREKFDQVEKFVRELLHLPEARLEVTHEQDKKIVLAERWSASTIGILWHRSS